MHNMNAVWEIPAQLPEVQFRGKKCSGTSRGWAHLFRIYDVIAAISARLSTSARRAVLLISQCKELERALLKLSNLPLDLIGLELLVLESRTDLRDLALDALYVVLGELVLVHLESLLSVVDNTIGSVARLDGFLACLILGRVLLGRRNHLLDLVVSETTTRLDGDGLLLVGGRVTGADVDDTVGIDVERHVDLRDTTRCWRDLALKNKEWSGLGSVGREQGTER
jgi:NAD-dependent glutamate dehydrogenase